MGWTCHMTCEVRVSLAHRGRAGFVVEILCHGVSPASSSTSHQRQLNGISTRRKLSQTTPPGRLQIAHRCHPRIVRCQRGWHWAARATDIARIAPYLDTRAVLAVPALSHALRKSQTLLELQGGAHAQLRGVR